MQNVDNARIVAMRGPQVAGVTRGAKPYLVAKLDARLPQKAKFVRLPDESEDAKMTGMTRSLHRRLLGLNLGGSLAASKILAT